jgi:hypothetical protein
MPTSGTSRPPGSFLPTRLLSLALIASTMPLTGCPKRIVLPDDGQVHQMSRDADLYVYCHGPDGDSWTECKWVVRKGSWIAPPSVVEKGESP